MGRRAVPATDVTVHVKIHIAFKGQRIINCPSIAQLVDRALCSHEVVGSTLGKNLFIVFMGLCVVVARGRASRFFDGDQLCP